MPSPQDLVRWLNAGQKAREQRDRSAVGSAMVAGYDRITQLWQALRESHRVWREFYDRSAGIQDMPLSTMTDEDHEFENVQPKWQAVLRLHLSRINSLLSTYALTPWCSIADWELKRWKVLWLPAEVCRRIQGRRTRESVATSRERLQEIAALQTILSISDQGKFDYLGRCANCDRWVWRRKIDQRFCDSCGKRHTPGSQYKERHKVDALRWYHKRAKKKAEYQFARARTPEAADAARAKIRKHEKWLAEDKKRLNERRLKERKEAAA